MLLFSIGNEYCQLGKFAEAIPYFENAVSIDPEYAAVYVHLAHAYEQTNHLNRARQTLERGWGPAERSEDKNLMAQVQEIWNRLSGSSES
jgi:Tfp pilus assembly protein PilF